MDGVRIIAGRFRHRTLESPPAKTTRPITDRVKQSLFDALSVAIGFENIRVLDVFAGTGSLGLESLSRGAREVVFVEEDRRALIALSNNVEALGVKAESRIVKADAFSRGDIWRGDMGRFDMIFFDPPYPLLDKPETAEKLDTMMCRGAESALNDDGVLLFRHPGKFTPESMQTARLIMRRQDYGSMSVTWIRRMPAS